MIPYIVINQFTLGPLTLYTWGLFVGLGFSAGYLLLLYLAKRKNLAPEKIAGLALAIFLGGALGAKTLPMALAPGGFFHNLNLLFSQHSGAAFMGGLIGAILFGVAYIKIVKLNSPPLNLPLERGEKKRGLGFWAIADLLVLPLALGIGIGRIGCILINEHQGAVTNLPWGILWPDGLARHPVGIYESLVGFGLFIIFWFLQQKIKGVSLRADFKKNISVIPGLPAPPWRWTRNPKIMDSRFPVYPCESRGGNDNYSGQLFLIFLVSYSAIRFFLDFTRVSSGLLADPRWGNLSVSQWISLIVLCFCLFFIIKTRGVRKKLKD